MRIDVTLKATFWNKSPTITIKVNNDTTVEVKDFIDNQEKNITFDAKLKDGHNELIIERINKIPDDTLVEDGQLVKDSVVEIKEILVGRNVIGRAGEYPFLLDKAEFFPEYPEPWYSEQKEKSETPPVSYKHCQTLHHNGKWKLKFESPVDRWFFEYYCGKRK